MARFALIDSPVPTGAVPRATPSNTFASVTAVGAVLFLLATIGSIALWVVRPLRPACARWAEQRRLREEDRQLWELALTDPRVMADLVALRQQAPGERSAWF